METYQICQDSHDHDEKVQQPIKYADPDNDDDDLFLLLYNDNDFWLLKKNEGK